ncbi:MAG: matrixin family metalloprotease [Anaerolineales bacterium]
MRNTKPIKIPLGIVRQKGREDELLAPPIPKREGKTIAPKRPADWKARRQFSGTLALRFGFPKEARVKPPATLRIAPVHRPRDAGWMYFEKTKNLSSRTGTASFEKMPAGEYIVAVQIPGYRPQAEIILHTRKADAHALQFPLVRADSPEQERDLLRPRERHPLGESMRRYLVRFGYLRKDACGCPADELCPHVSAALQRFQKIFRLEARGTLTLESFFRGLQPRCAVPDFLPSGFQNAESGPQGVERGDPIVFSEHHWDSNALRYLRQDGTSDISNEWDIIRNAMDTWADHSPLTFTETASSADSNLEFDFRRPGEADYPFDEEGSKHSNILAHAHYPLNGQVEFDDHEDWGDTSLIAVATHEIGHALGLMHTNVEDATMYPWYDSGQASLHETDVRGIKSLYSRTVSNSGPFVAVMLYGLNQMSGTDSVTIDLGAERQFLAWGSITMVDSLADFDRDNMYCIDIFEVDGVRTGTRVYGGDHWGTNGCPANVFNGARTGYGRRITFRISAGHVSDLEVAGYALVLVLD